MPCLKKKQKQNKNISYGLWVSVDIKDVARDADETLTP